MQHKCLEICNNYPRHLISAMGIATITIAILLLAAGITPGALAQAIEAATPTPLPGTLRLLDADAETLSVDYAELRKGVQVVQVAVVNAYPDSTKVRGEIIILNFKAANGKDGQLSRSQIFASAEVTLNPGQAAILEFPLLDGHPAPHPGAYQGFIVVADTNSGATVTKALQLTVREEKPEDCNGEPTPSYEILNSDALKIKYDELADGTMRLVVMVRNNGEVDASLSGKVSLKGLMDRNGNPVELVFRQVELDKDGKAQPVEQTSIPKGKTLPVLFELVKQNIDLQPGVYPGSVSFARDDSSGVSKCTPFSLVVLNATTNTYLGYSTDWLGRTARAVPKQLGLQSSLANELKLDLPFVVVMLILLGVLIRLIYLYRHRFDPGIVTVAEIVDGTEDKLQAKALTAMMQHRLQELGIKPPAGQPLGTVETTINNLVTQIGITTSGLKLIKPAIDFIWGLLAPQVQFEVKSTMRIIKGKDEKGAETISYEMIATIEKNRRSTTIEKVGAKTSQELVEVAAQAVYLHIIQQPRLWRRMPEWQQFHTREAFDDYQKGNKAKEPRDKIVLFRNAAGKEINNALVRMALGSAYVEKGEYLMALETYLMTVLVMPEIREARYRLAVIFSFGAKLAEQWVAVTDATHKLELQALLNAYLLKEETRETTQIPTDRVELEQFLLERAHSQFKKLISEYKYGRPIWKYLRTFIPLTFQRDLRAYYGQMAGVWPWGARRRRFVKVVKIALLSTEIQLEDSEAYIPKHIQTVHYELAPRWSRIGLGRWAGVNWQVRYNAACFYSLILPEGPKKNSIKLFDNRVVIEQVDRVMRDPESKSVWKWLLEGDPDLEKLRKTEEFKAWKRLLIVASATQDSPTEKETQTADKPEPRGCLDLLGVLALLKRLVMSPRGP